LSTHDPHPDPRLERLLDLERVLDTIATDPDVRALLDDAVLLLPRDLQAPEAAASRRPAAETLRGR
jgi:hypothetical protein